jgi:hypothetical protein
MNQLNQQDIYVMRLWHERSSHKPEHHEPSSEAWRVTITDTKTQQKHHFANMETLLSFFKEKLEDKDS